MSLLPWRRRVFGAACSILIVGGTLACGGEEAITMASDPPEFLAPVTFVVTGIEVEVWRVDIVVNGQGIVPVLGSFYADSTDRVMMRIPPGDSLIAFARAFEVDTIISFIGESFFNVRTTAAQEVIVPLKVKGSHAPT